MNRRRFATVSSKPGPLAGPALSTRLTDRLPLDVAISLSVEVLEAVAAVHQQQRVLGAFGASELTVLADGSVAVLSASKPGDDLSLDSFSVGTVLYQVFTGLTPNQARARCAVSPLHAVPPASLINPALDDSIDDLLARLLDKNAAQRPHSLRVVEAALEEVCELFDLEPSKARVAAWWNAMAPVAPSVAKKHVPSVRLVVEEMDEDSEDDVEGNEGPSPTPLRFDAWAVALCAFGVAAFVMATTF